MESLTPFIRPASLDDLDALCALESLFPGDRLSRRSFSNLLRQGKADILVCDDDGAMAGNVVILYRQGSTRARIYSLVVHPNYRRRGIARTLIKKAEKAARARHCDRLGLEVRTDNLPALRLYQSLGYETKGRIDNYYEDHTAAVRLEKRLTN